MHVDIIIVYYVEDHSTTIIMLLSAPGPVLNFVNSTKFTSIVLTWDPPDEPNGVIIRYEVTYRISEGNIQTLNTGLSNAFIISSLEAGTRVSDVSVSAYTSVGRGVPSNLTDMRTLSEPCELLLSTSITLSDALYL